MSTKELRAAGIIIYRVVSQEIQYLLLQTSYGQNHWTPPKGHVDPGESDFETAMRETEEESGLNGRHFKVEENFKKEIYYNVRGKPKTVVYWLAVLNNPSTTVKLSNEHEDFKWLPLEPAKKLVNFDDFNQVLNECQYFIQK